jgi:hypothetical protein
MATNLGRVKSTAASKYDAFVASQLKQAETRIRMLDLSAGLLGFATLSLAYILGMILCDSQLLLTQHARQLSLYAFLAAVAVYLFLVVLRPLRLRVNPYYAARQVEQQLPHAKNSIINWVDLHEQPLPPAIRSALGQHAAKDLAHIDLDRAISGRRAAWMGGIAGLFALAFIFSFFLLGPAPFVSLLKRTFNPFEAVGVSTRTRLTLLKPEGGNATLTVGRGINFVVDVGGKVPNPKAADAVKLLYRYEESDPWLERRLIQEASGEWTTSLSAIEVKNGFWYKITGGDAATEEYQVSVRAAAAITDFLATYHFRPYVARANEVRRERELKALRGTEVLLCVRTNRTLREGRLEFESNKRAEIIKPPVTFVHGKVDANEPNAFLVRFVLNENGEYRLSFTSADGEAYRDPTSYSVTAIPDQPPTVELTKPGKDIRLPADALLHLEGKASDDIGVRDLVLRMRVIGGDKLRGQPYRSEEQLRLADGGNPRELEYKDFVELSRVQSENGQAALLRPGMELEYWLEASDACDYPHPNVAESKHFRVLLIEPEKNDPKKNQQKKQAEKEKKQHEQKQDQKLQKENQERQQQRQEQQARNKEEENKSKSSGGNGTGEKSQSKENGQANDFGKQENKGTENNGQQGERMDGQGEAKSGEQNNELSKEDQNIEEKIKKALEKKQAGENGQGESKSEKGNSGEGKESGKENAKQAGGNPSKGDGKGNRSESKVGDSRDQTGKAGKSKDKPESAPKSGEGKSNGDPQSSNNAGQGKDKSMDQSQGTAKEKGQQSKGADGRKNGGQAERKQVSSAAKNQPSNQVSKNPGDSQPKGEKGEKGENKQNSGSSARNATAEDIADLARRLQSKDGGERERAKQQLQRIAKEANDAEAREKASDALKKEGQQDDASARSAPQQGNDSADKPGAKRKEGEKSDDSKDTDNSEGKSGEIKAAADQKNDQQGKNRQGSSTEDGPPGAPTSQDGTPGGGGDRRSDKGGPGAPPAQPKQPDKPRDHRAAQMQLEDFAKKVNKDILKEAGVSEEAWKRYLEAKRKQLPPREKARPEAPVAPQQANQLPSMGGRTILPAASGQGDTQSPDRGQPPPGYRDSFRKFTQQMSKKN